MIGKITFAALQFALICTLTCQLGRVAHAEEDPELHAVDEADKINNQVTKDLTPPAKSCAPADAVADQSRGFVSLPSVYLLQNGRRVSQVIYGEEIKILEHKNGMVLVAAIRQKTAGYPDGYQGWIPESSISRNALFLNQVSLGKNVATTLNQSILYSDPGCTKPLLKLSFDSRLPKVGDVTAAYKVMTPNGKIAYLKATDAIPVVQKTYSPGQVLAIAKLFIGTKYEWGGTSSQGIDCSGLIYRAFSSLGIAIPRNAVDQFNHGETITKDKLEPGDLVFFADGGLVHHVGIYLGKGKIIHAPRTGESVRISDMSIFGNTFAGARRYDSN